MPLNLMLDSRVAPLWCFCTFNITYHEIWADDMSPKFGPKPERKVELALGALISALKGWHAQGFVG
jgi:hypothetical protein